MKRFTSFLLCLLLLISLAVPVLADSESEEESEEMVLIPITETETDNTPAQTSDEPSNTPSAEQEEPSTDLSQSRTWTDTTFTDLTQDWYKPYVKFCYEAELMNGTGSDTFSPSRYGTRAQVVTVLYRLAGEPNVSAASGFSDVPEGEYYSAAVAWAKQTGVTTGYEDGTFRPLRYVTRQEFLTFLYRFASPDSSQWTGDEIAPFADAGDIQDYAKAAENWSVAAGLQTGYEENGQTFLKPTDKVRRSEIAAFLTRYVSP
jgi:hypothetical protein